ncbi:MAG: four-helix bundle copper-binding protein [Clostridia bacterium]|nr:four-helix bundle copper-binding protein [Clostridia bacterium]
MGIVSNITDKYQSCIDECNRCAQACYECFRACLSESNVEDRINCISTLIECAKMCELSSMLMSIDAKSSKEHCKLCADVCARCAKECNMFPDDHCTKCADECRRCTNECMQMNNM